MFHVKQVLGATHVILSDAVTPLQIKDEELFEWLKHELEELSFIDRSLFSERREIYLDKGTFQTIPKDCNLIIGLLYNIDSEGRVGRTTTLIDKSYLDLRYPNWRTTKPSTYVQHYMQGNNNRTYEVYPPQTGDKTTSVMVDFNLSPSEQLTMDSTIHLSDIYKKILSFAIASDYLCKDTADIENFNLGIQYKQMSQATLQTTVSQTGGGARR